MKAKAQLRSEIYTHVSTPMIGVSRSDITFPTDVFRAFFTWQSTRQSISKNGNRGCLSLYAEKYGIPVEL